MCSTDPPTISAATADTATTTTETIIPAITTATAAAAAFARCDPNAHLDAALLVHADALGSHDVAGLDDIFGVLDAALRELRDVDESVLAGQHFHEGAEGHRVHDLAGVDLADFHFGEHVLDHLLGAIERLLLRGIDVNRAVVLDVDLGTGLGLDALDVLSTGSDQFRSEERRVGKECRSRWSPYH